MLIFQIILIQILQSNIKTMRPEDLIRMNFFCFILMTSENSMFVEFEDLKLEDTIKFSSKETIPNHPIIYKQVLCEENVDDLIDQYHSIPTNRQNNGSYVYDYVDVRISSEIRNTIYKLFSNYVLIRHVAYCGRIHHVTFGGISEHSDAKYFNDILQSYSRFTLIIYLSDVYDGGQTEIRRQKFSLIDDNKEKFERHHITPKKGYGVLFPSELIHCAQPSYGDKYMLIMRIW